MSTFESKLLGRTSIFQTIRESFHDIPHLFFTGPPGSGKTSLLYEILDFIKKEAPFQVDSVLWLSSEKDRGIHTIRDKVNDFCKAAHAKPNTLRFIVIDDADTLPLISQQALRRPMETFHHLTRFLFASRHAGHLIEPLRSRCLTLEIEPVSPFEIYPFYMQQYKIPKEFISEDFFQFLVRNFTHIHEIKCIIRLYKSYIEEGFSKENIINIFQTLLPSVNLYIQPLVYAIGKGNETDIRNLITNLYLSGYLLDDILLSIEKVISLFPNSNPEIRFKVLQFTMLGWISIQQGREHWLDAMDIVEQILRQD